MVYTARDDVGIYYRNPFTVPRIRYNPRQPPATIIEAGGG
jgi:hypothetical protein